MAYEGRHPAEPAKSRPATASDRPERRLPGLRAHLIALVLAVLLPALTFGAVAAWEALRQQEALAEARLLDTARALAAAVDRQIEGHIGALQALAAAPGADPELDPEHFRAHARATAEVFGGWVVLYRRDGSQVVNTRLPQGAPLPGPGGAPGAGGGGIAITRAFDSGRPVVSDVALGRVAGQATAFAFAPVMRDGQAQAVVGMPITPEALAATLRGQAAEGSGAVALTDSRGVFVARSRGTEQLVGQSRPPRENGPAGESGVLRGRSVPDDAPIRTAYHALSAAPGWHVWVNEPEASFVAARRGPLLALGGGAALALLAGIAGGAVMTRRLLRPVEALVTRAEAVAASAIGPSETPQPPHARVAEFERLARAVTGAEAALRRVQRIGRVGGFEVDLRPGSYLRSMRSSEYLDLHGIPRPQGVERHADWVARLHPADRARAEQHFLQSVADGAPDAEYEQEYRIALPGGEVRWIYARGEIERDANGRALRMVGAHVDVTALKSIEDALRDSEERLRLALEAAQLGAWEMDLLTGAVTRSKRSVEILGLAVGEGDAALPLWSNRVHPDDRASVHAAINAVRDGREAAYRVQFRFLRPDGNWVWVESQGRVARSDPFTGKPTRLIGTTLDITERKLAEERQAVLVHELDHRAKNTLAVVQAALRLTPRDDVGAYARAVEGRVSALSRAHTLLAKGRWRGAELVTVAEEALAPFRPAGNAGPVVTLEGPSLPLAPAAVQALSMTMHELATNAAKHGALSVPEGRLDLRWTIEDGVLCIRWNEQGGPPVGAPPSRQGFGSSLITATMTRQLGGRITASWRPNGLEWTARLPVERLVPGREPPEPLVEEVGEPQAVHQAIQQAAQEAAQQSAQQSAPAA